MKIAIITLTKDGMDLGRKISKALREHETNLFVNKRFQNDEARAIETPLSEFLGKIFPDYDALVFVMALGIVVRVISNHIKNKRTDPSIVVVDEKGQFAISLLSGHHGANELARLIAKRINAKEVITTASEIKKKPSVESIAKRFNLVASDVKDSKLVNSSILNDEMVGIFTEFEIDLDLSENIVLNDLTDLESKKDNFESFIFITNKAIEKLDKLEKPLVILRPRNLLAGIGFKKGTSKEDILEAIRYSFLKAGLSIESLKAIATLDFKANEDCILEAARELNTHVLGISIEEVKRVERNYEISEHVREKIGVGAVSEPIAVIAGNNANLIQRKVKFKGVTVAIAEEKIMEKGTIFLVGIGPGSKDHMTFRAYDAIKGADVVIGYGRYLELIKDLTSGKEVISKGMRKEVERAKIAVDKALMGKKVVLVSGGDPGIYGMASVLFEYLEERSIDLHVEVVPGVTAAIAASACLGSPLSHDFAVISLSDFLTPWKIIEKRLESAAKADFIIVLYNPKSKEREWQIERAINILMKYKKPETPVGIVKKAMRENEEIKITTLKEMLTHEIDMQTTIIIGNSETFAFNDRIITPRGYRSKYDFKSK